MRTAWRRVAARPAMRQRPPGGSSSAAGAARVADFTARRLLHASQAAGSIPAEAPPAGLVPSDAPVEPPRRPPAVRQMESLRPPTCPAAPVRRPALPHALRRSPGQPLPLHAGRPRPVTPERHGTDAVRSSERMGTRCPPRGQLRRVTIRTGCRRRAEVQAAPEVTEPTTAALTPIALNAANVKN